MLLITPSIIEMAGIFEIQFASYFQHHTSLGKGKKINKASLSPIVSQSYNIGIANTAEKSALIWKQLFSLEFLIVETFLLILGCI